MPPARRIGVTGGIGSGKSTAVAFFAGLGAAIIDSDAIARVLTAAGGEAIGAIRAGFGAHALEASGALDRARMRSLVLADPAQRGRLEEILHPLIRDRCLELARQLASTAPLLVFDVPLLVEAAGVRHALALDRVLLIDCPPALQFARAQARGTLPEEQIRAIIAAQASRRQRLEIADDVLVNAGSLEGLRSRVGRLWSTYCPGGPV